MRVSSTFCCAILIGVGTGCESEALVDTSIQHPTLIMVSPEDFLGELPCGTEPGAVQRYVATLTDVTKVNEEGDDSDAGAPRDFVLPSSPPTSCTQAVGFAFVVPGHRYQAAILAYDRSDIKAIATGVPLMVDVANDEQVSPRWTAACNSPVTAAGSRSQRARGCTTLVDQTGTGVTAVQVELDEATLGGLTCGTEPGQVATFVAKLSYVSPDFSGSSASASCAEGIVFDGLEPNQPIELSISAFEEGALVPSWGTSCAATSASLVTVAAQCQALSDQGAVELDLPGILSDLGQPCASGTRVVASALPPSPPQSVEILAPACNEPFTIAGIDVRELGPTGLVSLSVEVFGADGSCTGLTTCTANPVPGQTVPAMCSAGPCEEADAG